MVDLDDEQYEAREVRDAYNNIKNRTDIVSTRIINLLDQELIGKLHEIDREDPREEEQPKAEEMGRHPLI